MSRSFLVAGYPTFKGDVLNGDQLWTLIAGLEENELLQYTHLVTGKSSREQARLQCETSLTK